MPFWGVSFHNFFSVDMELFLSCTIFLYMICTVVVTSRMLIAPVKWQLNQHGVKMAGLHAELVKWRWCVRVWQITTPDFCLCISRTTVHTHLNTLGDWSYHIKYWGNTMPCIFIQDTCIMCEISQLVHYYPKISALFRTSSYIMSQTDFLRDS